MSWDNNVSWDDDGSGDDDVSGDGDVSWDNDVSWDDDESEYRFPMTICFHKKCDNVLFIARENLFLARTTLATTTMIEELAMVCPGDDGYVDDYKAYIEKYGTTRIDFEKKMTESCKQFQQIEEAHLKHMKSVLSQYNTTHEEKHKLIGQVHHDFRELCDSFTIAKLILMFSEAKGTGPDRPGTISFEECDVSNIPTPEPVPREKLKKKLRKTKKKKNDKDSESSGVPDGDTSIPVSPISPGATSPISNNTTVRTPVVDEEGYTIRPQENKRDSFYSSSDDDSDQEERRKIHVEIKPAIVSEGQKSTVGNSVDELKAAIGGLTLSPQPMMERPNHEKVTEVEAVVFYPHQSHLVLLIPVALLHQDLLPVLIYGVIDNVNESPPALPAKQSKQIINSNCTEKPTLPPPSNSIVAPPRPPSRNKKMAPRASPIPDSANSSPLTLPRQDSSSSISSMTFTTSAAHIGSSRGPSPLTLGMSDTIPIAAAFTECVNAYFKGIDQTKCMVKITGDMMMSFPAGIIQVLTSNPSPAVLSFRIKNANKLEQILPNKQLVSLDESLTVDGSQVYVFNMSALASLLKRQSDSNITASYFNVDILKYQVKALPGVGSTPLQLCTYWKCEPTVTELRIDYRYNSSSMSKPMTLSAVQFIVPVDGGVTVMQSKPPATWSADSKRALWKLSDITPTTEGASSLRAKFDLSEGPSKPATVAVQFQSEGTTLSFIEIELVGTSYRLSLTKKRFSTGKYLSDS
uniref:FCH domain only protein 2-like n=1 Tax=Saccoglossus kowalevskii TaxID=10224 RepID=A0ABM0MKP3_SACKO|nr:PREDICTED: FCH domain only protein 2-like [Saccoglossus kowalevskii]